MQKVRSGMKVTYILHQEEVVAHMLAMSKNVICNHHLARVRTLYGTA